MWQEIVDQISLDYFISIMECFHDCCLKEMRYVSGSYVDEQLSMYPINSERNLRVIFQRQSSQHSMIEVEFAKIHYLKLFPVPGEYTCEILDSTLLFKDKSIIWCDRGGLKENELNEYNGTIISATAIRWRIIDGYMGNEIFYKTRDGSLS